MALCLLVGSGSSHENQELVTDNAAVLSKAASFYSLTSNNQNPESFKNLKPISVETIDSEEPSMADKDRKIQFVQAEQTSDKDMPKPTDIGTAVDLGIKVWPNQSESLKRLAKKLKGRLAEKTLTTDLKLLKEIIDTDFESVTNTIPSSDTNGFVRLRIQLD